ncbi:GNAT family N-acetyltransferase [Brevibacterium litoralis]|uniref:GNAT family N-acetyltransferase n=1 Tax=Brevibacterium litoralis TaxID=3138935 RepID=UPI0032F05F24
MPEYTLATPTPDMAPALARVHIDAWRETYSGRFDERHFSEEAYTGRLRMWERILGGDPGPSGRPPRVAVAASDDEPVGFALAGPSRDEDLADTDELFALYVLARLHGSGAGQALLDAVLGPGPGEAPEPEVDRQPASLWVLQDNPRAEAFYAKNGFVYDGHSRTEDGHTEVRMISG